MDKTNKISFNDARIYGNLRQPSAGMPKRISDVVATNVPRPAQRQAISTAPVRTTPRTLLGDVRPVRRSFVRPQLKVNAREIPKVSSAASQSSLAANIHIQAMRKPAQTAVLVASPIYHAPVVKQFKVPKVSVAAKFANKLHRLRSRGLVSNLYMSMAMFMIVAGAIVLIKYHKATSLLMGESAQAQSTSVTAQEPGNEALQPEVPAVTDGSEKDEKPVPKNFVYKPNPNVAHSISIASAGIFGYIRNVGATKAGAMATPASIFWGGWSSEGSAPGASGLAILNGHVSGPTSPGIFYKLNKVAIGDIVTIKKGDGGNVSYKVVAKESVSVEQAAEKMYTMKGTSASQLNIVTCDGKFDGKTDSFKNRLIVYTEKI